jgi:hypothetical protein
MPCYLDWVRFTDYRNALVHGRISESIPSLGTLAQEVETVAQAQLAHAAAGAMIEATAAHFGFAAPTWVRTP